MVLEFLEVKVQGTRYTKHYLAASVAMATLLVYLPALRNEFVNWDDGPYVFANIYIRSLNLAFFRWAFLGFHASNWHPLTWISHALDYTLWGLNPLGHHLTSIVLHALNTALVVVLAVKLLEAARERSPKNGATSFLNDRTTLIAAAVTGLLFGIHPVHVESVAWVSERKDLLCALFFLLSIIMYTGYANRQESAVRSLRSAEAKNEVGQRNAFTSKYYLLALGFFVLALMSKPMAVSLPVVLLILDWYPFHRVRSFKTLWASSIEKIPLLAISLLSAILTILAQKSGDAVTSLDAVPLSIRSLVALKSLVAYLGKMLLPLSLIPFYPYPRDISLFTGEYFLALALVLVITTVSVVLAKKQKLWLAAWGYYVTILIPVLGIVQVGSQAMADRYTYLPSLGPFITAGVSISWIVDKANIRMRSTPVKIFSAIVFVIIVASLSSLTIRQIAVWRNSIGLWTHVINYGPEKSPLVYVNRGAAFEKIGIFDKAIADFETATTLDPAAYRAYISLGTVFETVGQIDRAFENVNKAISLNPSSHEAFRNRGILYEKMFQVDKAIADYTQAIMLKPSYYEAYNNRGLAFAKQGQFERAIADYNDTIRINPSHFGAHVNRGVAFTLIGQYDKALEDFSRAILLDQNNPTAYFNRGAFYRRMGNQELSLKDFRKACDLGNEKACNALH